jgi:hypothetical protein
MERKLYQKLRETTEDLPHFRYLLQKFLRAVPQLSPGHADELLKISGSGHPFASELLAVVLEKGQKAWQR